MSAKNIGFVVGLICGIVLVAFLFRLANSNGKMKTEYDERQEKLRGIGYKYGFWAYTAMMTIMLIIDFATDIKISMAIMAFLSIVVAGLVLSVYCIFNGAYWGQNNNRKIYIIIFIVAGVINFLSAFIHIINGNMIVDGELQTPFINLLCGIMMSVVGIALALNRRIDSEEDEA